MEDDKAVVWLKSRNWDWIAVTLTNERRPESFRQNPRGTDVLGWEWHNVGLNVDGYEQWANFSMPLPYEDTAFTRRFRVSYEWWVWWAKYTGQPQSVIDTYQGKIRDAVRNLVPDKHRDDFLTQCIAHYTTERSRS